MLKNDYCTEQSKVHGRKPRDEMSASSSKYYICPHRRTNPDKWLDMRYRGKTTYQDAGNRGFRGKVPEKTAYVWGIPIKERQRLHHALHGNIKREATEMPKPFLEVPKSITMYNSCLTAGYIRGALEEKDMVYAKDPNIWSEEMKKEKDEEAGIWTPMPIGTQGNEFPKYTEKWEKGITKASAKPTKRTLVPSWKRVDNNLVSALKCMGYKRTKGHRRNIKAIRHQVMSILAKLDLTALDPRIAEVHDTLQILSNQPGIKRATYPPSFKKSLVWMCNEGASILKGVCTGKANSNVPKDITRDAAESLLTLAFSYTWSITIRERNRLHHALHGNGT